MVCIPAAVTDFEIGEQTNLIVRPRAVPHTDIFAAGDESARCQTNARYTFSECRRSPRMPKPMGAIIHFSLLSAYLWRLLFISHTTYNGFSIPRTSWLLGYIHNGTVISIGGGVGEGSWPHSINTQINEQRPDERLATTISDPSAAHYQ